MKKNGGNLSPINFRCQEKFNKCFLAKKKPSAYEVEEEKKKWKEKEMKKIVKKNLSNYSQFHDHLSEIFFLQINEEKKACRASLNTEKSS